MMIGYLYLASESLTGGLIAPHNALIASGVGCLYIDLKVAADARPQLDAALAEIGPGDVLVSPTVSTLTDSITGLLAIFNRLDAKGASLRLLELACGLPLDTNSVEGRAILSALAVMNALPAIAGGGGAATPATSPAPFAALMSRTDEQRPRGRPATACCQAHEVNRLRAQGVRAVEIATHLGIGRASVYRILSQGQRGDEPNSTLGRMAEPAGGRSTQIVGRFSSPTPA